jgi:hypothetical protein
MRHPKIISALMCIIVLLALMPAMALAGTNTVAGITLNTPTTYGSCTATGDSLSATNNSADPLRLVGQVIVQFVTEGGRVDLPNGSGFYPVDVTLNAGDTYNLSVAYPPASTWPVYSQSNPTRELHVDVQLEIVQNGFFIGSLGYGQDWDVFCQGTPPPPVFQGCTPGYYKNHVNSVSWAGIDPNKKVNTLFSGAYLDTTLGNSTLLEALSFKGGSTIVGKQEILLRAGVAAYINASHPTVDYPLDPGQVVTLVNLALNSTDKAFITSTASQLDSFNNLVCPLN